MDEEQEGVQLTDPETEGIELPEVDEAEEVEENTENVEEETSEENQEEPEQENKSADKNSSLQKALNAERAKRKQLEKQIKALQRSGGKSTFDKLKENGVDEELAKTLSEAIDKPNDEVADLKFTSDLLRLSKRPEFADIENYAEDVRDFVDKGLSIEQAYYAATGGKKRNENTRSEIKRELEAKMKNQKQKAEILDIDTNSNVSISEQGALKYSATELAMAKAAGMTIEEYKSYYYFSYDLIG